MRGIAGQIVLKHLPYIRRISVGEGGEDNTPLSKIQPTGGVALIALEKSYVCQWHLLATFVRVK